MEKLKQTIAKLLIIFVIFCIGFTFGKHHRTAISKAQIEKTSNLPMKNNLPVKVLYMHATFRCDTCNQIEKMAKAMLDEKYADMLKAGDIVWEEINFQQRQDLAEKFEVIASCIVVEKMNQNGKSSFERLDKVWTLFEDKKAFDDYLIGAIKRISETN